MLDWVGLEHYPNHGSAWDARRIQRNWLQNHVLSLPAALSPDNLDNHTEEMKSMLILKLILRWLLLSHIYIVFAAFWLCLAWLTNEHFWWPVIRDDFKRLFLTLTNPNHANT